MIISFKKIISISNFSIGNEKTREDIKIIADN